MALRARDEWRYDDVVALIDPASCDERFQRFCEMSRPMPLERFAEHYPDLVGDRLTDSFRRWQEHMAHQDANIPSSVPGITTYAELIALDAADFLARWLANDDSRAPLVQQLRARERVVPAYLLGVPDGKEYVVIGSVLEADDLAHVLYREVFAGGDEAPTRGPVEYEALRRQSDGAWRLLADHHRFLQNRGGSVTILDEEFADLWDAPSG